MKKATINEISINIKKSTYLNDYRYCIFNDVINNLTIGSGISNQSIKKAILIALGEFYERESLFYMCDEVPIINSELILGYSLAQKKIIKIDKKYKNYIFSDSCGDASHSKSSFCEKNALREFIERQSLIYNYLSKAKGKRIILNKDIQIKNILNEFKNVYIYNVSLIDNFYVILATADYNDKFLIGANSSSNKDEAINGAIKEMYACKISCNSNMDTQNKKNLDYCDLYTSIPTEKLRAAYSYLKEKSDICYYDELNSYEFDVKSMCRELYDEYKINPILFYMPSTRNIGNLKVAKFFDFNWFPSLNPNQFTPEIYDFVEQATDTELDRKCNFIPFP